MPSRSGATPIIWNDHIFLNVATAMHERRHRAVGGRPQEGRAALEAAPRRRQQQQRKQNMSSPSPVTDGTTVWVMTGTGILKAFDFKGTELWTRDIQKDYGRFGLNWGYASSPLLHQGCALHPGAARHEDRRSVVRDAHRRQDAARRCGRWTGRRMPSRNRPTPTPRRLLVNVGTTNEIVVTGGDVVTGHDPATGKELWRANGLNPQNDPDYRIIASPIVVGGLVIAPTREPPDAGAQARRQRRRHDARTRRGASIAVRTCRRRSATASFSTSSTTAASCTRST